MYEDHKFEATQDIPANLLANATLTRTKNDGIYLNRRRDASLDQHSRLTDSQTRENIQAIADRLAIGSVLHVESCGMREPLAECYLVQLGNKNLLLKTCSDNETDSYISDLNHVLQFIKSSGARAPSLMPIGDDGECVVNLDDQRWVVFESIPKYSHFGADGEGVYKAAMQLGRLDVSLIDYAYNFPSIVETYLQTTESLGSCLENPKLLHLKWHGFCRAFDRLEIIDENSDLIRLRMQDIQKTLNTYSEIFPDLLYNNEGENYTRSSVSQNSLLLSNTRSTCLIDLTMNNNTDFHNEIAQPFWQIVKNAALQSADANSMISFQKLEDLGKSFANGYAEGNHEVKWRPLMVYGYTLSESLSSLFNDLSKIYIYGNKNCNANLAGQLDTIEDIPRLLPAALGLSV